MITKHILAVMAIILVACMIAPQYVSAAEYVDKTINLEIESKYQSDHDEVVNVANTSSIQNPDTWIPAPQAIWIGASTQESLFAFDPISTPNNELKVASIIQLNRSQVMNGASEWIVRSPIAADGVLTQTLTVIRFDAVADINLRPRASSHHNGSVQAFIDIDMSDTSVTTGEDCWTVDGRTYVLVRCPIYSGIQYALQWNAVMDTDRQFTIYMSGQDIANDNITRTLVTYYTEPSVGVFSELDREFAIDPGISFDLLTGLGNGVYANSFHMDAGDTLQFRVINGHLPESYHTIMLPFETVDGTLNATVTVQRWSLGTLVPFWSNGSRVWYDYILASTDSTIVSGDWSPLLVTITVHEAERVNWIFSDSPRGLPIDYIQNAVTLTLGGVEHTVFSSVWNSYQPSLYQIYAPSMNPSDFPASMQPETNQKATWYGTIIGVILVVIGGAMVATGILAPVGVLVAGVGAAMIIADVAKGGQLIGSGTLPGWMENALDAVRDALAAVGKFIISIGEGLWDALTWLVDAIVEYGSILLAILCLAVVCILAFFIIWGVLKLFSIGYKLAKGDLEGATAEGATVVNKVGGIVGRKPPGVV